MKIFLTILAVASMAFYEGCDDMKRTTAAGNIGGQHTDGDPGAGTPATVVDARIMNNIQNELVGWIEDSEQVPDALDEQQIRQAVMQYASTNNLLFNGNFLSQQRISHKVLAAGETKEVSDGWNLSAGTGIAITNVFNGGGGGGYGFKIEGTGAAGDSFTLSQIYSANRNQPATSNQGTTPPVSEKMTAAVRALSRSVSASVECDIDIEVESDPGQTITELSSTQGRVGGSASDVATLAAFRFESENESNRQTDGFPSTKITVTLVQTGTFAIYFSGAALWKSVISDSYIPVPITGDHLRDRAFVETLGVKSDSQRFAAMPVVAMDKTVDTLTGCVIHIPWRRKLQRVPEHDEITFSITAGNSFTLYNNGGVIALRGWTGWDELVAFATDGIMSVNEDGISLAIEGEHTAITGTYVQAIVLVEVSVNMTP